MKTYTLAAKTYQGSVVYLRLLPTNAANRLAFTAGQYAALSFRTNGGRYTPARCFSMVSTPDQTSLLFALRVAGRFTRTITHLPLGTEVAVDGPFGNFVVNPSYDKRIVLIAGGIGITPCFSIIQALSQHPTVPVTLLYSCKSQDDIPLLLSLQQLWQVHRHVRIRYFITRSTSSAPLPKNMESRRIEGTDVGAEAQANTTFFICGPRLFTQNMSDLCRQQGVGKDRIVSESFSQNPSSPLFGGLNASLVTYSTTIVALVLGVLAIVAIDIKQFLPKLTRNQSTEHTTIGASTAEGNSHKPTPSISSVPAPTPVTVTSDPSVYQPPITRVS